MWNLLGWQSRPSASGDLTRQDAIGKRGGGRARECATATLLSITRVNDSSGSVAALTLKLGRRYLLEMKNF